jgi:hypothetical protein
MLKNKRKGPHNDYVWLGIIALVVTLALCFPGNAKAKCEFAGGVYDQAREICLNRTGK